MYLMLFGILKKYIGVVKKRMHCLCVPIMRQTYFLGRSNLCQKGHPLLSLARGIS